MMMSDKSGQMICPGCGASEQAAVSFCSRCGRQLMATTSVQYNSGAVGGQHNKAGSSRIASLFMMFLNPGGVIKTKLTKFPWPLSMAISGTAFAMFFLQTALDISHHQYSSAIISMTLLGAIYGTAGIVVVATVAWLVCQLFGNRQSLGWTIRAFGLGYSPTLVYASLGLAVNLLLGWNTAIAFGVTGVVWAIGPLNATIKEMVGGKIGISVVLTTVCGCLVLWGWALLGTR